MKKVNNDFIEQMKAAVKSGLFVMVIALSIWQFMGWLQHPATLPIKQVRIEGELRRVTHSKVSAALSELVQTGYFAMDTNAIVEKVTALEWVSKAKIRRVWPDTIVLSLKEQQPVAIWNETALLNKQGEIFEPVFDAKKMQLPQLHGVDSKSLNILEKYKEIECLLAGLALSVVQLEQAEHGSWSVVLSNGVKLNVGHDEPENKIKHSLSALAALDGGLVEHIQTIDLRYPNGMAVTWKDGYEFGQPNTKVKSPSSNKIKPLKG